MVLYPNPVTSRLYIRSVNGFKNGYVFIYNLNGELIAKRNYNDGLIDFDFGTLPIGVYIIRVYDGNVFVTKKLFDTNSSLCVFLLFGTVFYGFVLMLGHGRNSNNSNNSRPQRSKI